MPQFRCWFSMRNYEKHILDKIVGFVCCHVFWFIIDEKRELNGSLFLLIDNVIDKRQAMNMPLRIFSAVVLSFRIFTISSAKCMA